MVLCRRVLKDHFYPRILDKISIQKLRTKIYISLLGRNSNIYFNLKSRKRPFLKLIFLYFLNLYFDLE
jgi:hypothetical protein